MLESDIKYTILRSKRFSISISINYKCEILVRCPMQISENKIAEIVKEKKSWICKKISVISNNNVVIKNKNNYQNGELFLYLGKWMTLNIINGKRNFVYIDGDFINIEILKTTNPQILLEKYMAKDAKIIFNQRLKECIINFKKFYNLSVQILKIRKMKRRWGSMSKSGIITLNLFLLHYEYELIDYVIMHELSHTKEMNHSRKFYNIMSEVLPNWKDLEKKLTQHCYKIL